MDFRLTEEQAMLRDTLSRYLSDRDPLDARLKRRSRAPRGDSMLWQALATELGIVGAALPAAAGGMGGDAVETMVVMDALGEALATVPYLSSVVLAAGVLPGAAPEQRARAVSAAKAVTAEALRFVAQNAVQLHGAMGMTDELAVGHYFRRATAIEQQFGAADHHVKRYAALAA